MDCLSRVDVDIEGVTQLLPAQSSYGDSCRRTPLDTISDDETDTRECRGKGGRAGVRGSANHLLVQYIAYREARHMTVLGQV